MSEMKSRSAKSVDAYLKMMSEDVRVALEKLRKIIKGAVPDATELISYRIPIFKYEGHLLVGFGATKNHCSFYVMSSSMIPNLGRARYGELKGYNVSGATIHFTPHKPLPAALVRKLVKERIAENENRANRRGGLRRLFFSSFRVGICSLSGRVFLVRSRRF